MNSAKSIGVRAGNWLSLKQAHGGCFAAAEFYSGRLSLVDISAGRVMAKFGVPAALMTSLAFSPDDRLLASGGYDSAIRVWDTSRHELIFTLRRPSKPVEGLAFGRGGSTLYACYASGPVRVWSTTTAYPAEVRELIARLKREDPVIPDVWHHLENDPTLDERQRAGALRQCPWRLDWDQVLREHVWGPAVYSPDSVAERKLLLRRAENIHEALPWSVEAWTILGAAQYRNGLYGEAARTLARASAVACDDPRADAFLAMTLSRLGQAGKARASLDRARLLVQDADAIPQHDGQALVAEAEALLTGRR